MESKAQRVFSLMVMSILLSTACSSKSGKTGSNQEAQTVPGDTAATNAAPPSSWNVKMQSLSQVLSNLMPMMVSRAKFSDPANSAQIEKDTSQLRALAHSLKSGNRPNLDPSMKIVGGLFEEDIDRAMESLKNGNREYARQILKDATSYCIQCHTQTSQGANFPRLNLSINTDELSPLSRAEFFAATRQFDRALDSYKSVINSPQLASRDPFEWEQATRSALAIVVRVKNDPKEAASLLEKVPKVESLPTSTKSSIRAWRRSIRDWASAKAGPVKNDADQLNRAEAMIQQAQKKQGFPLDHSQDILYFRAAKELHEFLSKGHEDSRLNARALYWSGVAAEATRDMNFWTLHEKYYETCIRTLPHSKQSAQCFAKLKESVTLGYSGSGGVRIPSDVTRRLETYSQLAKEKTSTEKSKD